MLGSLFRETVIRYGDSTAILDGDVDITYLKLARCLDLLTAALAERFQIGSGDRVAVSLPNCWQFAALFFSITDLGAVFVPINPNWRSGELKWCVNNIRPSIVVAADSQTAFWKENGYPAERIVSPELITALSYRDFTYSRPTPPSPPDPDDHALYLFTSGSTGFPKVVPRSHRNLVVAARNVDAALGGIERKRFLGVVPFHHAYGLANSLILPLLTGGSGLVVPRFLPDLLLSSLKQFHPDVLIGSPFVYRTLIEKAEPGQDLGGLGICLSSGAPIPSGLVRAWRERLGPRIRQIYGTSETGTISIENSSAPADLVTAGQPVPSVEVRINPAQNGAEYGGEILVRSPAAMSCYLFDSSDKTETFVDGFFRTGDLGRFDDEGNIVIQGRRNRIINLKGLKADPVEIENLIREFPGVADCLVTSVGEGSDGVIKAVVSVRNGCFVTRRDLVELCRRRLAEYKIPRIIEFTEEHICKIL